jgi:hypothetical protein
MATILITKTLVNKKQWEVADNGSMFVVPSLLSRIDNRQDTHWVKNMGTTLITNNSTKQQKLQLADPHLWIYKWLLHCSQAIQTKQQKLQLLDPHLCCQEIVEDRR